MKDDKLVQAQLNLISKVAELNGTSLSEELDRLIPAKCKISGDTDYYKGYIIDLYVCESCGRPVGDEIIMFNFCPSCGKKLERP